MYLVRKGGRKRGRDVVLVDDLNVRYNTHRSDTGRRIVGMAVVEAAGVNKKSVLVAGREVTAIRGVSEQPAHLNTVYTTADAVKGHIRGLRPQEQEQLAEVNARIVALDEQLRATLAERQDLLQAAFTKGHVVPLKEIMSLAEKREAQRREKEQVPE